MKRAVHICLIISVISISLCFIGCPQGPKANFEATPLLGPVPLDVQFTSTSSAGDEVITYWYWDFGDGQTSYEQNPLHTFTTAGQYTVALTVATEVGTNTKTRSAYVTAQNGPQASFGSDPQVGPAPLDVQFSDSSVPGDAAITSWSWDFGDGGTSTEQAPLHTFEDAGEYTISLTVTTSIGSHTETRSDYVVADGADEETILFPGNVPLTLVRIPAGTFQMGANTGEQDASGAEFPHHTVTLTHDFWMGKYELTKAQWKAVTGTEPWAVYAGVISDGKSPAVPMTRDNALGFVTALTTLMGETYRLPTEAEWEYACRAGTTTRFYWGDDGLYEELSDYAWWGENATEVDEAYPHVSGQKGPNAWGLYDMSGNVWEWCQDWSGNYTSLDQTDPTGPATGSLGILRGGSWTNYETYCFRSAFRNFYSPTAVSTTFGFRVCRPTS